MLADNLIDLQQAALMIDWCAGVLDGGSQATTESSMAKVAVSDALFRIADRCVQVQQWAGDWCAGVSRETPICPNRCVQVFREQVFRAFRIYDGPTEVHKWSLARKIKRDALAGAKP
jgi:acyl-CoA dehydrogenase